MCSYVGVSFVTGEEFDASWDRGGPFRFTLGAGMVIPGWDAGVKGMRVGGRRKLTIPSRWPTARRGAGGVIKPHEPLVFVVDLLEAGLMAFETPTDLRHNRGLIDDPETFAKEADAASWLFSLRPGVRGDEGGISYEQVQSAVPESLEHRLRSAALMGHGTRPRARCRARHDAPPDTRHLPTGPRSSALVYLYAGLQERASADEVIARAEADGAPFTGSDELKAWVAQGPRRARLTPEQLRVPEDNPGIERATAGRARRIGEVRHQLQPRDAGEREVELRRLARHEVAGGERLVVRDHRVGAVVPGSASSAIATVAFNASSLLPRS